MKKLSLWNKFSKYIHKSFQKWPFLVQVGSKAQQPPRSPIKGHFWRREYGPSNCTSRSQRKPSSENIPPRRQLQIPSHKSFDQRELRPSQNYVTPLGRDTKTKVKAPRPSPPKAMPPKKKKPASSDDVGACAHCERHEPTLSSCSRCGLVKYCSRDCQRARGRAQTQFLVPT